MNISIYKHNYTLPSSIRQENILYSQDVLLFIDLCKKIFSLRGNGKRSLIAQVMNELLYRKNEGKSSTVAQQTIATKLGCTKKHARIQIGRLLRTIKSFGIIEIEGTHHQQSTYISSPLFDDPRVSIALRHLLPELKTSRIAKRKENAKKVCEAKLNSMYLSKAFKKEAIDSPKINYSYDEDDQKMYHSLLGINYINNLSSLENAYECDDGVLVDYVPFDFDSQPDLLPDDFVLPSFLPAADLPIGCVAGVFKKNNQENHKTASLVTSFSLSSFPSQNILLKSSSKTAEHKKGSGMEDNLYEKIIPVAAALKSIRPTKWGQIKLSAFSDEAILYADSRMLKTASIVSDKFRYFVKICKTHSEEQQLPINWSTMIELGAKHKMSDEHVWLDESFVPVKIAVKPKKWTADNGHQPARQTNIDQEIREQIKFNKANLSYKYSSEEMLENARDMKNNMTEALKVYPHAYSVYFSAIRNLEKQIAELKDKIQQEKEQLNSSEKPAKTQLLSEPVAQFKQIGSLLNSFKPPVSTINLEDKSEPVNPKQYVQMLQSMTQLAQPIEENDDDGYDPSIDPFGDRL